MAHSPRMRCEKLLCVIVSRYNKMDPNDRSDFKIGCRILTQPFFFEESDWIDVPKVGRQIS